MATRRTKTTAKKTTALARVNQGALALPGGLSDEFAPFVNRDRATAKDAGWAYISTRGSTSRMTLSEQPIGEDDGGVPLVVLGSTYVNSYFEGKYDPNSPRGVVCYAIADPSAADPVQAVAEMGPPKDLKTRKAEKCAPCPMNAFGSGEGRGKACKNTVRLATLPAGADYGKADGAMLSVPPTSLKAWSGYVRPVLDGLKRPVATVITKVFKVPNEQTAGFKLHFELVEPIQDEGDLRAILTRMKGDGRAALEQPPSLDGGDAVVSGGAPTQHRRKVTRKKSRG